MPRIVFAVLMVVVAGCSSERALAPAPQPQKSALLGCRGQLPDLYGCEAKPLLLIDGKRASWDGTPDLNPSEIESVEVLKGQAALRLYGADGKNGVVQITTRKGLLKL